jgi:hypothetical protein
METSTATAAVHAREILDTVHEAATFSCLGLRRSTLQTSELGALSLRQPLLNSLTLSNDLLPVYESRPRFEFISLRQTVCDVRHSPEESAKVSRVPSRSLATQNMQLMTEGEVL